MKNIKVTRKTGFIPCHIEFDLETKDQALALWHMLNVPQNTVETQATTSGASEPLPRTWDNRDLLWNKIDDILKGKI